MSELPNKPFTTKDFSLKGGGIDFLGLRWVSLTIVGRDLLPELNNQTNDMGTFFLGGWIPWKFRQLCSSDKVYTEKNFKIFREKVEVAFSLALQDELEINRPCGQVRNRVGITRKCLLPSTLSFEASKRTDQNSLYAAAIYGPILSAFGLVKSYNSLAREGAKPLKITVAGDDSDTLEIVKGVDQSLRQAAAYKSLASLDSPEFSQKEICKLAEAGLDTARFRHPDYCRLQVCFRRKLLPQDPAAPGYARTLTTRLLLATLKQREQLSTEQVREAWYTGMFEGGKTLRLTDPELADHAKRWSCFLARQYQRYAIELFLWCFEDAISKDNHSIDAIVKYWTKNSKSAGIKLSGTFQQLTKERAGSLFKADEIATSQAWNQQVNVDDDRFEYVKDPKGDQAVIHGLRMFAGWYWRMLARQQDPKNKLYFVLGDADRMSMNWFIKWLTERKNMPLHDLLKDIFSDLVFSQHMRVALSRFDGSKQRLRFLIGDSGIEPTVSARDEMGKLSLPWMPDRLDTLVSLLCDCGVLIKKEGKYHTGPNAKEIH